MRPSSIPLSAAFVEGATLAGADVVDVGLASTDLVYFASGLLDSPAAMFTASHNPAQYNGIKMCRAGAAPVGEATGLVQIKEAVAAGLVERAEEMGRVETRDLLPQFARHVTSFVDTSVLRPLKVVADTANGMGGLIVPAVFDGLPFDVEMLFAELDGTFPNHPADPIQPENLVSLQKAVLEAGADVGLAFDGDADRVFLVDDQAQPISGSITTAIVAKTILEKTGPGESVVYNLICSKVVPEVIREMGGTPIRIPGRPLVHQAGDGRDRRGVRWRALGPLLLPRQLAGRLRDHRRADGARAAEPRGPPLSELRKPFERYAQSGEINTTVVSDPPAVIERVAEAYRDDEQDRLDGLTVDLGDWWFNLRPSNTEPLLRLNVEAADRLACDAHTEEVLELIRSEA